MIYKLKTPNSQYNGVTEGVPFSKGIGQTDNDNIRNVLVNDYKYEDITDYSEIEEIVNEVEKTAEDDSKETSRAQEEFEDEVENEKTGAETTEENTESRTEKEDLVDDVDPEEQETSNLEDFTVPQLKKLAKDLNLSHYSELTKPELIKLIENA